MTKSIHSKMPTEDKHLLASVGDRIRQIRLSRGLTQEQLGQGDFSKSYLSAVELGKIEPSVRSLRVLAERLEVPLAYLLGSSQTEMLNQEGALTIARARLALELKTYSGSQKALKLLQNLELNDFVAEQRREAKYLLACSCAALERYDEAIERFLEVKMLWQETGFKEWLARIDLHVGEIYLERKLYDEARKYLHSALEIVRKGEVWDYFLSLRIINVLTHYYQAVEDNTKLPELLNDMESLVEAVSPNSNLIQMFDHLATEYATKGDFVQARTVIERAIAITGSMNFSRDFINSFWLFGEAAIAQQETEKAIAYFNTGLKLTNWNLPDPQVVRTYNQIARLYLAQGNIALAKTALQHSKTVSKLLSPQMSDYSVVIGQLYMVEAQIAEQEGKVEETEQLFLSAEKLLHNGGKRAGLDKVYFEYGNILIQRGLTREGYEYLRKAVELK
jgi:tetratricopeptide (TPR) repeat protein